MGKGRNGGPVAEISLRLPRSLEDKVYFYSECVCITVSMSMLLPRDRSFSLLYS